MRRDALATHGANKNLRRHRSGANSRRMHPFRGHWWNIVAYARCRLQQVFGSLEGVIESAGHSTTLIQSGRAETVSEVSKNVRRENFSLPFELWRVLMTRVGSFGGAKMSFETVSGQPHSKTLRAFRSARNSERSWSAAVLCRFGFGTKRGSPRNSQTYGYLTSMRRRRCRKQIAARDCRILN